MKLILESFTKKLNASKKTILLIVIVIILTLIISSIASMLLSSYDNITLPSIGTIYVIGIEAYGGDLNETDGQKYIDWGAVYPGASTNRSLYIKSKSNKPVTLNLTVENLVFKKSNQEITPELQLAEAPINVTINFSGPINPNEEIYITLTLKVSQNPEFIKYLIDYQVTNFSFDMHIITQEEN